MMNLQKEEETFVCKFVDNHNHELLTPKRTSMVLNTRLDLLVQLGTNPVQPKPRIRCKNGSFTISVFKTMRTSFCEKSLLWASSSALYFRKMDNQGQESYYTWHIWLCHTSEATNFFHFD